MDIEKLIDLVRIHPALYDSNNVDYTQTKKKDEIYARIAGILGLDSGK